MYIRDLDVLSESTTCICVFLVMMGFLRVFKIYFSIFLSGLRGMPIRCWHAACCFL